MPKCKLKQPRDKTQNISLEVNGMYMLLKKQTN